MSNITRIKNTETGNYIVYKATFVNGKTYFGITKIGLKKRKERHYSDAKRGSQYAFHKALNKYSEVKWEILYKNISEERAKKIEVRYISLMKSRVHQNGYNITAGGEGHTVTIVPFQAYTFSGKLIGTFESIAEAAHRLNADSSLISRCLSGTTKAHNGYIFTRKTFEEASRGSQLNRNKKFEVIDNNGVVVGIWNNTNQCARDLNLPTPREIRAVLTNPNRRTYKGYTFNFIVTEKK